MTEIIADQMPPALHGPSEKERKYDRQLRLWAASGQNALESAHILLVNSGPGTVGVETLKNLVLPGIGRFTIIDDAIVKEADLGVNFFLDDGCLGKVRSQCCAELLQELNPDVQSDWYPKGPNEGPTRLDQILRASPLFTMIIYTFPISPEDIGHIQSYAQQHHVPLVALHSAGFYSYFRVHLPGAFPIVETHPEETATTDLRLLRPWKELAEFAAEMTADIDKLDNHEYGHIPFVVILLYYLERWKEGHDGKYPSCYADKSAFRKMVFEGSLRGSSEGPEENFEEAAAAVMKTIVPTSLPPGLREVFDHQRDSRTEVPSSFWIIADALGKFYQSHGCLPLPGNLPDMKAQSNVYIKLQNIYKAKARQDASEVLEAARAIPGGEHIDPAEVDLFCKNAAFVKLVNSRPPQQDRINSLAEEELGNDATLAEMGMPTSLIPIYLALVATSHSFSPPTVEEITSYVKKHAPKAAESQRVEGVAQEVVRAAGGELHNISAATGGMVAQEMIKIITKQYIPIDNTCVFDGIGSRCQIFRL